MKSNSKIITFLSLFILSGTITFGQSASGRNILPVRYEEITATDFAAAIEKSKGTCILPFGILEKHGPHLPLGTDLLDSREIAVRAAEKEYVMVFPQYYFGQIYEAKHQPGTIAYSHEVIWKLLQETCDELSRNGIKKIVIVNGHGGNNNFLKYFCQAQLESRKDYAVILFTPANDPKTDEVVAKMKKSKLDGHAGETETSTMLVTRSDLVQLEKTKTQNGEDLNRLSTMPEGFAGIWWYAKFPNHYSGDGSPANKELGEILISSKTEHLINLLKEVKENNKILELQNKFFDAAENPLKTGQ